MVLNVRSHRLLQAVLAISLRLPGFLFFEVWWRNRSSRFNPEFFTTSFTSYLEIDQIIQFIQTRNLDQKAAEILSYAALFLSVIIFFLSIHALLHLYLHAFSLLLFGLAHYLSVRYVHLEQNSDPDLKLDEFNKLERHGFHILAQLVLCVIQSCLLGLESDLARASLAVFLIPVIARMCAAPVNQLIVAHNVACSLAMLQICIYVLVRAPRLAHVVRQSIRVLYTFVWLRGINDGVILIWRRLHIAETLVCAWLAMYVVRIYVHVVAENSSLDSAVALAILALHSVAECIGSPLSLLALVLCVHNVCTFLCVLTSYVVSTSSSAAFSANNHYAHVLGTRGGVVPHVLTLALFAAHFGLVNMHIEQKAFILAVVFFIMLSSVLQSLVESLEPQLLELAANQSTGPLKHSCSIILSIFLCVACICVSVVISRLLPADFLCMVTVSNSILTIFRIISILLMYCFYVSESRSNEPSERLDDWMFICKVTVLSINFVIALAVALYGIGLFYKGHWSVVTVAIFVFYVYHKVWCQLKKILNNLGSRRYANKNLSRLPLIEFDKSSGWDSCAICLTRMASNARMTPCSHFFHNHCLRKWLFVKQVCPLCYSEICLANIEAMEAQLEEYKDKRPSLDITGDSKNNFGNKFLEDQLGEFIQ